MKRLRIALHIVLVAALAAACSSGRGPSDPPAWSDTAGAGVWQSDDVSVATGAPPADPTTLTAYAFEAQGTQHVVYASAHDMHLVELWWNVNGWHLADLTTSARGVPAAPRSAIFGYAYDGQMTHHVIFVGADHHLHELWSDATGWHSGDLTTATNSALPAGRPETVSGYVFSAKGTQNVAFVGVDNHIYQLTSARDGWYATDLTSATGTPPPASNSTLATYAFESEETAHVVYTGVDGHLHELWSGTAGWRSSDLSAVTSTPGPVNAAGAMAAYSAEKLRTQHIVFTTADGRLLELSSGRDTGWRVTDLSAVARALPAQRVAGYAFDRQGTQHIVYVGADNRLYELWWTDGWHTGNLTAAAGDPQCGPNTMAAYAFEVQQTQHVVCIAPDDGHIQELWWGPPPVSAHSPSVR